MTGDDGTDRYWAWSGTWRAILLLALGVLAARLIYLAFLCPYTLVEDEAHYWEWARRLDWSYYSKGPGVAWAIAASTAILGNTELGVRAPSVLFGSIMILGVAGLGANVARDRRAGFAAGLLVLCAPMLVIASLVMTVDVPYLAMWSLAAWAAWRALGDGARWGWLAFGAAIGVGFLFKYTVLLLLPGILLFLLLDREKRAAARAQWPWILAGLGVMTLGLVPVLVWNAANDWVTVKHLMGHLGLAGGDMPVEEGGGWSYDPRWTLEFLATQFGAMLFPLLLAIYSIIEAVQRRAEDARRWSGQKFLICCAAPIIVFYLLVTVVAQAEANWAMAGYTTLLALAGWGAIDAMDDWSARLRRWRAVPPAERRKEGVFTKRPQMHRQLAWHFALGTGVILTLVAARIDLIARIPVIGDPIPIGRFTNADELAAEAQALIERVRADEEINPEGRDPIIIAQHYGRASILAFYLPDHPIVYCSSSIMGGRQTQYDFWEDTDLADPDLLGRPGVMLGGVRAQWWDLFERVSNPMRLDHEPKSDRVTFYGYSYTGPRSMRENGP